MSPANHLADSATVAVQQCSIDCQGVGAMIHTVAKDDMRMERRAPAVADSYIGYLFMTVVSVFVFLADHLDSGG